MDGYFIDPEGNWEADYETEATELTSYADKNCQYKVNLNAADVFGHLCGCFAVDMRPCVRLLKW